jgi:hypothetical protein
MAVLGPIPAQLEGMFEVVCSTLETVMTELRPGATLGAVADTCKRSTERSGYNVFPILHARALGEDAPMLIGSASKEVLEWPIRLNQTYAIKVQVREPDGSAMAFWGESMVIGPAGATRLGQEPMRIMSLADPIGAKR